MTKQKQIHLKKQMAPYEKSDVQASVWQIINTIIPFFLLWFLAYKSLSISYIITLAIAVIAAGFLIRIFIIFHDCCHHSFFKNRTANKIIGTITGIITVFPFSQWQHDHSVHHATSSNLDKRGVGDIWMLTVDEYIAASFWQRVGYRLYRNPIIMFGFGPIYQFLIVNRFNRKGARVNERINTYLTNVSIVILYSLMCWAIGWEAFVLVQGPIFLISGAAGIWLFYVQHTFEDSYFEEDENWEYVKAAVEGSSFYKLPKLLQWLTGNIGYHHVHHLSPRVPNYKLEEAHNNTEPLRNVPTVTLKTSLSALRFKLWDELNKTFVTYKEASNYMKNRNKKEIA
ncbi:fatty acid desaturase [Bacillus sp. S/N-304-OC-R1]|uniref:fatty acid desaturase n=1 Tax=Bacillus sp. S/N-304-OC-R1 TaxID=2758034 RepID=UPI001C8CF4D9|nr:fatty acid desaturase [Bacillus sp. S/N-304-OC-R1]MBY0120441.1 fatty acid desaturase [Bacillus sp. S/N-304-OC-R1]